MNERIQELAEQAGVYFGEAHKDYFGEKHPAFIDASRIDVKKFAELIVRECADLHDFNSGYYEDNNEWCSYYDKILKHFGVEE